jgi:hypothetical protein
MSGPLAGMGRVALWGLSPAQDLLQLIGTFRHYYALIPKTLDHLHHTICTNNNSTKYTDKKTKLGGEGVKNINILLAGETDSRHALKTVDENWDLLQENEIRLNVCNLDLNLCLVEVFMLILSLNA